jgi:nicotinamide-nucleotide amidase
MTLENLAETIGGRLKKQALMLSVAESCTGGWIAKVITDIAGSSQWFDRGFVTYTNQAKQEMLGVRAETLLAYGAVSEQTVQEMADGVLAHSAAQFGLAVSGVAGPGGGTKDKPVGMVCFAWSGSSFNTFAKTEYFTGDREQVRRAAVEYALSGLLDLL